MPQTGLTVMLKKESQNLPPCEKADGHKDSYCYCLILFKAFNPEVLEGQVPTSLPFQMHEQTHYHCCLRFVSCHLQPSLRRPLGQWDIEEEVKH